MPEDHVLQRLRAAVEAMDTFPVSEVVDAAWDDAVAEARSIIQALMTKALLEQAVEHLQQSRSASPSAEPPVSPPPTAADEPSPPPPGQPDAWVWYVYGVQSGDVPATGAEGVDGHDVMPVAAGGLQALVSRVPAEEFGEEALPEKVADLEWLSAQAQRHEAVLRSALERGAVLPLRFGTVYRSRERVGEFLAEHADALTRQLEHLAGHQEWSLKILVDDEVLGRWTAEHDPAVAALDSPSPSSEGHAYFVRKRREAAVADARERVTDDVARACHDRLAAVATAATTARPQDPSLSGYTGRMVLNGIYLVADAQLDTFRSEIADLEQLHAARGFDFVMTGPWPAHNFVEIPDGGSGPRDGIRLVP